MIILILFLIIIGIAMLVFNICDGIQKNLIVIIIGLEVLLLAASLTFVMIAFNYNDAIG